MTQSAMPSAVEVLYKRRDQRLAEVRIGITLDQPGIDSDSVLAGFQNEGQFDVTFDPAEEKYDFFYRSISETGLGDVLSITRTLVRVNLVGDLNATDLVFIITPPTLTASISVGDMFEIEDELMVIQTVDTVHWNITVEERGAHGTSALAHVSGTQVSLMIYSIPHNSLVLSGFTDTGVPLAPTSLIVRNSVGAIGNGLELEIGLPITNKQSLIRYKAQLSTVLWDDSIEDVTTLKGILATGIDGAITQGGTVLTTVKTIDAGWVGKLIYTHEGIDLVTGVITFPFVFIIDSVVNIASALWQIKLGGQDTYKLRKGAPGSKGVVNFFVADGWQVVGNPITWIGENQPFFTPEGDTIITEHFRTAETVFTRARLRNYEGWGPFMYWDGSTGTTTKASAVTFTPTRASASAHSRGTMPATTDITMIAVDNDTVSWSAGNVAFADGTTESVTTTGSPKTLAAPDTHYVYKLLGNSTLQFTTTFTTAIGNDRTFLGIVTTISDVNEFASVFLYGDTGGPTISAAIGNFGKLSALTANLGAVTAGTIDGVTITGGTIQTASSGQRVKMSGSVIDKVEWTNASGTPISNVQYNVGTDIFHFFNSSGSVRITAGGSDGYDFTTTSLKIASGNSLDMNNGAITSCGDIELDSLTKDGAGNILINDIIDMGGRNILNVGQLECDSLIKDGAGDITVFDTLLPSGTVNLGSSGARWDSIFAVSVNFSGGATIGDTSGDDLVINAQIASDIIPDANDTYNLGSSGLKWADVFAVLVQSADFVFASNWKLREWPATKEDIHSQEHSWFKENANLGIQIVDDDEHLVAVIHKDGHIYCKGVRSMEELPK